MGPVFVAEVSKQSACILTAAHWEIRYYDLSMRFGFHELDSYTQATGNEAAATKDSRSVEGTQQVCLETAMNMLLETGSEDNTIQMLDMISEQKQCGQA
eukprot:7670066-Karenia_brevis.AAC.1